MSAFHLGAELGEGGGDGLFGRGLRGPALLISGETKITIGDKNDGALHGVIPSHRGERVLN
jgi:hypothetical protein